MPNLKFQKGLIQLGLIVLVLVGLTVASSFALSASGRLNIRPFNNIQGLLSDENQQGSNRESGQKQSGPDDNCGGEPNKHCNLGNDPGPCYPWGDVDNDGKVTYNDSVTILKYIRGINPPVFFKDRADLDANGKIEPIDAGLIRAYISGNEKIPPFPVCGNPQAPKGPCPPLGDANGDGVVNIADVRAIISYAHGVKPAVFFPSNADVNKDGAIFSADAELIQQFIAGTIKTFPGCINSHSPVFYY